MSDVSYQVESSAKMPKGEHYAIIYFHRSSGDDGYGGTNYFTIARYFVFNDVQAWEAEIEKLTLNASGYSKEDFIPLHVRPARVTTSVKVDL